MIYDCFTFNDELDLLEIRLNELSSVVDYFVLVESNQTFSGKDKVCIYQQNKSRFNKFNNKIIHIVVKNLDKAPPVKNEYPFNLNPIILGSSNSWFREHFQRNCILNGLKGAKPHDVILIGDVDEIPNIKYIKAIKKINKPIIFGMKVFYYFLNCQAQIDYQHCTRAVSFSSLKVHSPQYFRSLPPKDCRVINNSGWHFSYLYNKYKINTKINSFSHQELNTPEINSLDRINFNISNTLDLFERSIEYKLIKVNKSFPAYIYKNQNKYLRFIKSPTKNNSQVDRLTHEIIEYRRKIETLKANSIRQDTVDALKLSNSSLLAKLNEIEKSKWYKLGLKLKHIKKLIINEI